MKLKIVKIDAGLWKNFIIGEKRRRKNMIKKMPDAAVTLIRKR